MNTLFTKAIAHVNAGEFSKARGLFEQCVAEQCHDQGDLAFHLGWCLENDPDGDRIAVLRYYEQAFVQAPALVTRVNSAFRSGWIVMQDRDHERAESFFQKAVELAERVHLDNELYHYALFWRAVCLENKGQYLSAIEHHKRVQRLSPVLSPESRYREIICHNQVGRYEEALGACRSFLAHAKEGLGSHRYAELHDLVKKEEAMLIRCLGQNTDGEISRERLAIGPI